VPFHGLQNAFEQLQLSRLLRALKDPSARDLPDLSMIRKIHPEPSQCTEMYEALMRCGKRLAAMGRYSGAITAFNHAHEALPQAVLGRELRWPISWEADFLSDWVVERPVRPMGRQNRAPNVVRPYAVRPVFV
jgi:hypothetical protein